MGLLRTHMKGFRVKIMLLEK